MHYYSVHPSSLQTSVTSLSQRFCQGLVAVCSSSERIQSSFPCQLSPTTFEELHAWAQTLTAPKPKEPEEPTNLHEVLLDMLHRTDTSLLQIRSRHPASHT